MNKPILFFTALLFLVAGLTLFALARRHAQENVVAKNDAKQAVSPAAEWAPGEPIENFTLTERSGQAFDSKSLEGQVWVANFFFSSCPANCRQQNTRLAELQKELGPKGVKFVSITCDPESDTPDVLASYARGFNANPEHWKFLTGDMTYISYIGREVFDVMVTPKVHTENFILVDQNGVVRGYYTWNDPLEIDRMKETIRGLLDGSIPPAEKTPRKEPELQAAAPVEEETPDDEPPATLESPKYEPEAASK